MKSQLSKFIEFLKTPFPYLFLALCLFLASTLLSNNGFTDAMRSNNTNAKAADRYDLCLVCSGPGAKDALSDIGFTVANFVLIPVTLFGFGVMALLAKFTAVGTTVIYALYLGASTIYGIVLPFLIFMAYEAIDARITVRVGNPSIYSG